MQYILLFDFDAIEKIEQAKRRIGASHTIVSLPNYAFEILRKEDHMTDEEYCKATYQMATEEGWFKDHAAHIDAISPVNCPELP